MRKLKFPYRAQVVFPENLEQHYKESYPFKEGDIVCVLGEITRMEGHYVIALPNGKVVWGYHNDFLQPFDEPKDLM